MNKKTVKKEFIEWIKAVVIALIIVMGINVFYSPTMVYSISMYPTLVEKDFLILKHDDVFEKGDIVSFETDLVLSDSDIEKLNPLQKVYAKSNPNKNFIKRVIGVAGDEILIENGLVYVNGLVLEEPYISSPTTGDVYVEKIEEGQYFLMGDNRSHSFDSRDLGTIDENKIVGKVTLRVYPMERLGSVD